MTEPLVYTSKGNLPIKDLDYFYFWEETEDYIKFSEGYKLNDEIIKQAAHIKLKRGQDINAELAEL